MGLDWRGLTYPEYQLALAGWNRLHEREDEAGGEMTPERADRLKRLMASNAIH